MSSISGIHNSTYSYSPLYGQLASGNRLTSASQGAAELSIVEKQKAQATGYDVGSNNMQSGQNLLNISDAALEGVTGYLQRIRELSLQASSSALMTDSDRQGIQGEIDQLKQGIQDIATQTQYNTKNLLDGSQPNGFKLASDNNGSSVSVNDEADATLSALGIDDYDVTGDFDLGKIDKALETINKHRSSNGAQMNRLSYAIKVNNYTSQNTTAASSRMGDTDYPKAISELKKKQALQQYAYMMQKKNMENEARRMQNFFTR